MRLFRSFLFVPGNRERMLAKALTTDADALLFDLEDAVPDSEKDSALEMTVAFLLRATGLAVFVRISHPDVKRCQEELRRVVPLRPFGLFVPKVESAAEVQQVDGWLTDLEREFEIARGSILLVPMVESAKGLRQAFEISSASARVGSIGLASGENGDFQTDLGYEWSVGGVELQYSRSKLVVDSRAAGLEYPIDGVFADLESEADLIAESLVSKRLGFKGRMVIHPKQIAAVNQVYSPTPEEIAYFQRLLQAFERAVDAGHGTVNFEGKMVDKAMAGRARAVLALAGPQRSITDVTV